MIISANGIVFNEFGEILLIQRDDTRTLAPPGGGCELDELPDQTAEREVEEETGIKVRPVRLTGLYYLPSSPTPFLFLNFRCIQRGGTLNTSHESPQAGFFPANPPPGPMLPMHRLQIEAAFAHAGGSPDWDRLPFGVSSRLGFFILNRLIYPWLAFRRARQDAAPYVPPPNWVVSAGLVLRNQREEVLWQRRNGRWTLPTSLASANRPPWEIAAEMVKTIPEQGICLVNLVRIVVRRGRPEMQFLFSGVMNGDAAAELPASFAYFAPGDEPAKSAAYQREAVAMQSAGQTNFTLVD
jgi:8-oxo-dGTP diphosphatase